MTGSGILPPGTCTGFGSAYLKSRSSDSFTAALKDFIAPVSVNIANCGRIVVHKQTVPDGAAGSFAFGTTGGNATDGLPASFNLSDGGELDSGVTLQGGSYTVTETDPFPAFTLTDITCTATTGSSVSESEATGTATITLAANGLVDCVYTNTQQQHEVIVIVCHEDSNTLAASDVTIGTTSSTSLSAPPAGITEAQLCALGGANFGGLNHGSTSATIDVGSDAQHP